MREATVRDVAAEAGVSVAAVSRVLTGGAPVAPATRDRVHAATHNLDARERLLGYRAALAPAGVAPRAEYEVGGDFSEAGGYRAATGRRGRSRRSPSRRPRCSARTTRPRWAP